MGPTANMPGETRQFALFSTKKDDKSRMRDPLAAVECQGFDVKVKAATAFQALARPGGRACPSRLRVISGGIALTRVFDFFLQRTG